MSVPFFPSVSPLFPFGFLLLGPVPAARLMGHQDLWLLKAALDDEQPAGEQAKQAVDKEHLAA